jgi:hypothetical protein
MLNVFLFDHALFTSTNTAPHPPSSPLEKPALGVSLTGVMGIHKQQSGDAPIAYCP